MATVCKMQMQSFNRTVNANDIFVENGNRLVLSMWTCWNLHHTPLRVVKQWNLSKTLIRITHVPPFNWNELKNYQLLLLKPTHNANTQKVVSFWSVLKGYRITFYDTFDETFSPRDQLLCQPFPYIFVLDGNSLILIISISHSHSTSHGIFRHYYYPHFGGHYHFQRYLIFKKLFLLHEKCKRATLPVHLHDDDDANDNDTKSLYI